MHQNLGGTKSDVFGESEVSTGGVSCITVLNLCFFTKKQFDICIANYYWNANIFGVKLWVFILGCLGEESIGMWYCGIELSLFGPHQNTSHHCREATPFSLFLMAGYVII